MDNILLNVLDKRGLSTVGQLSSTLRNSIMKQTPGGYLP